MFRFFRTLRQRLLSENRASRYMLYALGEILLVVVGILLALQVNTWNEAQKALQEEELIIRNLQSEYQENLRLLQINQHRFRNLATAVHTLMGLIGKSEEELGRHNLDSLISKSIDLFDYNPADIALSEILATGRLSMLRSDALKKALLKWSNGIKDKEEAWETMDQMNQNLLVPYLMEHISLKNVDRYGPLNWEDRSLLPSRTSDIFQDLEFENNLDNHAWAVLFYVNTLDSLEVTARKIIHLTHAEVLP